MTYRFYRTAEDAEQIKAQTDAARAMLAALVDIAAAYLPDQPAASGVDERTYAMQHIAKLRKRAFDAIAQAEAAGIKEE